MPANPLQQTTDAGQPSWISGRIPTQIGPPLATNSFAAPDLGALAYVGGAQPGINVVRPDLYDVPAAAHEATHVFQNSRNDAFQNTASSLTPETHSPQDYNYGGIKGLQANPQKTVANYNLEQQAQMVEDLTRAQSQLRPGMTPQQLQAWDTTKTALERPIGQLAAVPPQNNSLGGKIDRYLDNRGFGTPISTLSGMIAPPRLNAPALPPPPAPSVALGYANPSKLVR